MNERIKKLIELAGISVRDDIKEHFGVDDD